MSYVLSTINVFRLTIYTFFEIIAAIVVAVYGFFTFGKSTSLKWVRYYCFINAVLDSLAITLAMNGVNNMFVVYLLIWAETYVLFKYFREISNRVGKMPGLISYIILYSIFLSINLAFENYQNFNPYSLILESILVFTCCIIFFYEQAKAPQDPFFFHIPDFWFASAFLVYYGSIWLILIGAQYFLIDYNQFVYIWDIQNVISVIKNVGIMVGLYHARKI